MSRTFLSPNSALLITLPQVVSTVRVMSTGLFICFLVNSNLICLTNHMFTSCGKICSGEVLRLLILICLLKGVLDLVSCFLHFFVIRHIGSWTPTFSLVPRNQIVDFASLHAVIYMCLFVFDRLMASCFTDGNSSWDNIWTNWQLKATSDHLSAVNIS